MATETSVDISNCSTETEAKSSVLLEFRCTRCWNSNVADSNASGTAFECASCGHQLIVPAATPERIARAQTLSQEAPTLKIELGKKLSDQDLVRLASEELSVPLDQQDFSNHPPASLWARLFALLIDTTLLVSILSIAIVFALMIIGKRSGPNRLQTLATGDLIAICVLAFTPIALSVVQWYMISCDGQTIGKKLLMVRVVTMKGGLPGFVQGVVIRVWVSNLLSMFIPFYGLIDAAVALGDSRRSLHDWISGTRVVQVQ